MDSARRASADWSRPWPKGRVTANTVTEPVEDTRMRTWTTPLMCSAVASAVYAGFGLKITFGTFCAMPAALGWLRRLGKGDLLDLTEIDLAGGAAGRVHRAGAAGDAELDALNGTSAIAGHGLAAGAS